jgi:hypothetical protein
MSTLAASTVALGSGSATDDSKYAAIEARITDLTAQRDDLVTQIRAGLNDAEFGGPPLNEQQAKGWIDQANGLIGQASALAATS